MSGIDDRGGTGISPPMAITNRLAKAVRESATSISFDRDEIRVMIDEFNRLQNIEYRAKLLHAAGVDQIKAASALCDAIGLEPPMEVAG